MAQREGVAVDALTLVNDFRRDSALLGRTFQAVTAFDTHSRHFFSVLVDRQSGEVVDREVIEAAEAQAHQAKSGLFQPGALTSHADQCYRFGSHRCG